MLKKLDLYIIKKFLGAFGFTMLLFTIISVAIDFSTKVEKFIEKDCTVSEIIFDYYVNFVWYINGLLVPLYVLIAVIFFTSRLAFNSEFISILNAGVSYRRIMRPYILAAGVIVLFHLYANHFLIPHGNKVRLDFEHKYIWVHSDQMKKRDIHMFVDPETKVFIRHFRKKEKYASDLRLEKYKDGKLVEYLKCKKAQWLGPPNKWQLEDYEIRYFDGIKEGFILGAREKMDTTLNITPDDFVRYKNQMEMMDTAEMQDFIKREKSRGLGNTQTYSVETHQRTAEPFSTLILSLLGLSIASRKVRGGIGLHLAIGIGLGALYVFLSKFAETFATNLDVSPVFAIWIPNIVYLFITIYFISRAQK